MQTLQAYSSTPHTPSESLILSASGHARTGFEGPTGRLVDTSAAPTKGSIVYTGHLGVLRSEDPTLERQRRYDFWFKRP